MPATTPAPGTTCTVVVAAPMVRCGAPAVVVITSERGTVYAECAEHTTEATGPAAHAVPGALVLRTRSSAPLALVAGARIVGYAHSRGPAVAKRAARLGALVLPIVGGRVFVP